MSKKKDPRLHEKLRQESFINDSGELLGMGKIPILKERHYWVRPHDLDGDAPKYFIKAYFFEQDGEVRAKNLNSWRSFIAKSAEKWYPHESVLEFMINRVGETMGLNMNKVRLAIVNGQIRFLSQHFRGKNDSLIHGAEICGQHLNDPDFAKEIAEDRNTARELFTFELIHEAIQNVFPEHCDVILQDLVRMIAFDAISGNNDRHFYNWGVLDSTLSDSKPPKFAPIYDSARGFLWNWSDEKIIRHWELRKNGGRKIDNYIRDAAPRISCEDNKKANHFQLIEYLKERDALYLAIINDLSDKQLEDKVVEMLKVEFFPYFIKERQEVIEFIVRERFETVRRI